VNQRKSAVHSGTDRLLPDILTTILLLERDTDTIITDKEKRPISQKSLSIMLSDTSHNRSQSVPKTL